MVVLDAAYADLSFTGHPLSGSARPAARLSGQYARRSAQPAPGRQQPLIGTTRLPEAVRCEREFTAGPAAAALLTGALAP